MHTDVGCPYSYTSDADVEDNIESDASRKRAATLGSTDRADLSVNGRISPPCGEVTGDVEKCLTPTPAEIASHNASNRTNTKSPVTLEGDRDCVSLEHNSQSKDSEKLTEISEGLRTLMLNDNKMLEREKGNQSPSTGRETPMHNSVVVNGPTESAAADTADGDRTSPRPKSPKSKHSRSSQQSSAKEQYDTVFHEISKRIIKVLQSPLERFTLNIHWQQSGH